MSDHNDSTPNLAIFCDFENVAIGVKEAKYDPFDISIVLQRLLDKGSVVVKKAYADWERYKASRRALHEAAFELIEIPHVSYSGKNSADIRLVVDALDLCYTKSHVDVFVIVSGDSDFSPLVSKLRENNKKVIGLGVRSSSSDLLIANCDEFIYYDDLIRDSPRGANRKKSGRRTGRRASSRANSAKDAKAEDAKAESKTSKEDSSSDASRLRQEGLERVIETVDALFRERDDNLWGSMVKQTLKRKRPNFSEGYLGYRSFNQLLEDAQRLGLLELQKDEKSGGYLILGFGPKA